MGNRGFDQMDEVERDYNEVLDIVVASLGENYKDFDEFVDVEEIKNANKTAFEMRVKEKRDLQQKMKEALEKEVYEKERFMRTRMTMRELLDNYTKLSKEEYERRQMNALDKFMRQQGIKEYEGDEFKKVLDEMDFYVGPYSMKMAQEFLDKAKAQTFEAISIVKMEYFLYGVKEAHRCI